MSRWIAAFLVILTAIAFSAAQDTGEKPLRFPFGSSKSQVPFDVIQVDGKTAWRVAGRGNVKIEELIAAYSSATGKLVSYEADAAGVARGSVPYIGPDGGVVIEQGELGDYVSGLIAAAQITLVGHSTDKVHIVSISNAPGYARVIEASELAGLPDSEWVTIARADLANSGNVLRYALEHYRRSSVQIASQGEMFVATGRVEQIRNVNRIIEKLDKAPSSDGSEVRAYDLGAGGKLSQAGLHGAQVAGHTAVINQNNGAVTVGNGRMRAGR